MNKILAISIVLLSGLTFASSDIFIWSGKVASLEKPENIVITNGKVSWDAYGARHNYEVKKVQALPHQLEVVERSDDAVVSLAFNI